MTHFQLQLGVVAEGGQMVRGKGVPQHVRLPVLEVGSAVQAGASSSPVRRTDPLALGTVNALQDARQRREDGDVPCAAGLAMVRGDADDSVVEPHVAPAQAFHFVRAHACVEHDGGCGEAGAALEGLGGVHQPPDLLLVQDSDALFFDALRLHPAHWVLRTPPPLARRGKDPAEDESRFVPLPRRVESLLDVFLAFLGGDAAHAPIRQTLAASHESFRDVAEVAQSPRPAVLPRFPCFFHSPGKGHCLFAPPQFLLSRRNARHGALHASSPRLQRPFGHQRRFQHIHSRLPQHLHRRQLRLSIRFCLHGGTYSESVCKKNMTLQRNLPDLR